MFLFEVSVLACAESPTLNTFPSHVQNVPESLMVFVPMTFSIPDTDSSVLIIPSISQLSETWAISLCSDYNVDSNRKLELAHVATSPGCMARIVVPMFFLHSSTAMC